jgi:hypothetical protein
MTILFFLFVLGVYVASPLGCGLGVGEDCGRAFSFGWSSFVADPSFFFVVLSPLRAQRRQRVVCTPF